MRVHQRTTGVTGIDGRVSLDEFAGLTRIVTVRVGAVQRAHNTPCHGETEIEWIAKCQHRLAWLESGGVAPGKAWKPATADFNHGEISHWICTDKFCRQYTAVIQRHADIGGSVNHVVIGHDITVRRNDDAATKSMFYLRTTAPLLWAKAKRPKEALDLILLAAGNLLLGTRRYGHIHHCRSHVRRQGFHSMVKRGQCAHTVVV